MEHIHFSEWVDAAQINGKTRKHKDVKLALALVSGRVNKQDHSDASNNAQKF